MSDTNIDIEDILECSIDSAEFLQCCNGLRMVSNVIDWKSLLTIMIERNETYCEVNGLCEICRHELEDYDNNSEHFGMNVTEKVKCCPRCG
jgi:hypothetical protein